MHHLSFIVISVIYKWCSHKDVVRIRKVEGRMNLPINL